MSKPNPLTIDPQSPAFNSLDEAAKALGATFPNANSETAGMIYKDVDGKFKYSTTMPGTDEHFSLRAAIPKGASLGAIVHSHPGKDALGQTFSGDDIKTADQLKLPSYVRFLGTDDTRVYRPGVTKTEHMSMPGNLLGQIIARGDPLVLPPPIPVREQIAQLLPQPLP